MLGIGRPCLLQIVNPKVLFDYRPSQECLDAWMEEIASKSKREVLFTDAQMVDGKVASDKLKEGEETKSKVYRAVVYVDQPVTEVLVSSLNTETPTLLSQATPLRVLQRRANLIRDKTIFKIHTQYIAEHYFLLFLHAQAGTYIKEFVHGDLGRTSPSLGSALEKRVLMGPNFNVN